MPTRKIKGKKYNGVYEYYRKSDPDKAVVAYYIAYRDADGKVVKIRCNATTKDEAVVLLAQAKANVKRADVTPTNTNASTTFSELAKMFFSERTTANNIKDKRRYELHIKPVLGNKKIHTLKKSDISNLQKVLVKKDVPVSTKEGADTMKLTPKTINNITDIASRIMQWALDEEKTTNQILKIKKLPIDNERSRIFSDAELKLIFESTDGDTKLFLMMLYYTGQRPESILRLQKKDIINGYISIEGIKKQKSHSVPISSKLEEILEPWIKELAGSDYIISKGKHPMPYKTMAGRTGKLFGELFNSELDYRTDIKQWASLYTLRHTALSNVYANSGDIYSAQAIANHSSVQMTQRYAKRSDDLKRNALDSL